MKWKYMKSMYLAKHSSSVHPRVSTEGFEFSVDGRHEFFADVISRSNSQMIAKVST